MRQAESCRPITRCDLAGGYTNLPGLAALPDQRPPTAIKEDLP